MEFTQNSEIRQIIFAHCYGYDQQEWLKLLNSWNEPSYRATQLWQGLYKNFWMFPVENQGEWTTLPLYLRDNLSQFFQKNKIECVKINYSTDRKTIKASFLLEDNYPIESVLINSGKDKANSALFTLCLSTQSGCPLNCDFCATGKMGFYRNLLCAEIIAQWAFFSRFSSRNNLGRITHIVFMGMGEPFLNTSEVYKSLSIITHPQMINIGQRKITISTIGIPKKIIEFAKLNTEINLAISLHAARNELRNKLVPINKKYPLEIVLSAASEYIERTKRRISFEYTLIEGVNDSIEEAQFLSRQIKGLLCHVNLILLNPSPHTPYQPTSLEQAKKFQLILQHNGIPCTIRGRRGIDINAGCGQLALSLK